MEDVPKKEVFDNRNILIPEKRFAHDGSYYTIRGNVTLAEFHFHEVRSYLHQLKLTNVNHLPIVSGTKYFDDGTIASYLFIYGRDEVHIFAPLEYQKSYELKEGATDEIELIVPCIRSIDDKWFVACLSGTFEGPYYAFPNTYDLPAEALDDNTEVDIDKQLISVGINLIDDSIDVPQLYFIAQTGIRPEDTDLDSFSGGGSENINISHAGDNAYACPWLVTKYAGAFNRFWSFSLGSPTTYQHGTTVFGDPLDIQQGLQGTVGFSGSSMEQGGGYVIDNSTGFETEGAAIAYMQQVLANMTPNPATAMSKAKTASYTDISVDDYYDLLAWNISVRIEEAAHNNFCAAYLVQNRTTTSTWGYGSIDKCNFSSRGTSFSSSSETLEYEYYWKVNDREFLLKSQSSEYPRYDHDENCMKYYNTDSPISLTALLCLWYREVDYFYNSFNYYYVGPNSDNELKSTVFIPDNGDWEHIIPNVEGIDATVKFKGKIFMGRIVYEVKR